MTDVTIIGAGNMARGIGTRLAAGGTALQILAPTPEHATSLADELAADGAGVTGGATPGAADRRRGGARDAVRRSAGVHRRPHR